MIEPIDPLGRGDYRGGWGHNDPYSVYFHAEFDRPCSARRLGQAGFWLTMPGGGAGAHLAAVASFAEGGEINLRVGVSHVSIAKARASVAREVGTRDFEAVRRLAEDAWAAVLGRVRVEGGTPAQRTLFATLFTRLCCLPTDLGADDEFASWQSGVRHFSDFYCLWDSVRNANSLPGLIAPRLAADLLNCLLDIGDKTGWVPDARIAGHPAFLQGGGSAAVLAGEAALKNTPGIDYTVALRLLRRDAEEPSLDPDYFGRYLVHYRDHGYVSAEIPNCVPRHLESAYQDWCLAQLAAKAGDPAPRPPGSSKVRASSGTSGGRMRAALPPAAPTARGRSRSTRSGRAATPGTTRISTKVPAANGPGTSRTISPGSWSDSAAPMRSWPRWTSFSSPARSRPSAATACRPFTAVIAARKPCCTFLISTITQANPTARRKRSAGR